MAAATLSSIPRWWCSSRFLLVLTILLSSSSLSPFPTVVSAQEAPDPALFVERFGEMPVSLRAANITTFRTDFCPLAQQLRLGQVTLENALNGLELRPALMEGEFVNLDYEYGGTDGETILSRSLNEDFPGLVPMLLDEICRRAKCEWRNSYSTVSYVDFPQNKSFLDLLLWSTELYDLAAEWWMRSVERLKAGATFTEQWYDDTIIMVSKIQPVDSDSFDPWGWLDPFDRSVWVMIVFTVIFSALLHYVLEFFNPQREEPLRRHLDPVDTVWQYATAFAGQFEFEPTTAPTRILSFSMAFWALLVIAAYTANLTSFLVIRNRGGLQIASLDQAVNEQMTMCVWRGTQTDHTVTSSFPTYSRSGRLKRLTQRGVYEGLQKGDCEIAITEVTSWDVFQQDATVNGECNLEVIGVPFLHVPASFGIRGDPTMCTSLLRDVFDLHLHHMQVDGTIAELWQIHKAEVATVDCDIPSGGSAARRRNRERQRKLAAAATRAAQGEEFLPSSHARLLKTATKVAEDDAESEQRLSLTNMGGVFLMHAMFCALALACAVTPPLVRWIQSQRPSVMGRKLSDNTSDNSDPTGRDNKLDDEDVGDIRFMENGRSIMQPNGGMAATTTDQEIVVTPDPDDDTIQFFDSKDSSGGPDSPNGGGDSSSHGYLAHNTTAALDELRVDVNSKLVNVETQQAQLQNQLGSIEEKLAALLDQKENGNGGQNRKLSLAATWGL